MSTCYHDITEREIAIADGMCPLCMAEEIKRVLNNQQRIAATRDAEIQRLRALIHPFEGAVDEIERLHAKIEQLYGKWEELIDAKHEIERLRASLDLCRRESYLDFNALGSQGRT